MAGAAHRAVHWYVPSPDGRHVACGVSQGGSERSTLHVVEVGTGRLLDDAVTEVPFPFVSWLEDGGSFRSFLYHRHPDPPAGAPPEERRLDSRSLLHRLGDDTEADVVVLARGLNPRVPMTRRDRPFLAVSPNEGWLLAIVSHGALGGRTTDEELTDCTLYVAPRGGLADPASCPWRRVAGVEDAVAAYALTEETLYLVSGRDAPRYQVLAVPLTGPGLDHAGVVVPQSPRVVEAVKVVGDHHPGVDGRPRPRGGPAAARLLDGRAPRLPLPGGVSDTGWAPPSPAGLGGLEERRVEATARDGTPIPCRSSTPGAAPRRRQPDAAGGLRLLRVRDASRVLTGDAGLVRAGRRVRRRPRPGRGRAWPEWHEARRGPGKETTVSDLIDCAEHLVGRGTPARTGSPARA